MCITLFDNFISIIFSTRSFNREFAKHFSTHWVFIAEFYIFIFTSPAPPWSFKPSRISRLIFAFLLFQMNSLHILHIFKNSVSGGVGSKESLYMYNELINEFNISILPASIKFLCDHIANIASDF